MEKLKREFIDHDKVVTLMESLKKSYFNGINPLPEAEHSQVNINTKIESSKQMLLNEENTFSVRWPRDRKVSQGSNQSSINKKLKLDPKELEKKAKEE